MIQTVLKDVACDWVTQQLVVHTPTISQRQEGRKLYKKPKTIEEVSANEEKIPISPRGHISKSPLDAQTPTFRPHIQQQLPPHPSRGNAKVFWSGA